MPLRPSSLHLISLACLALALPATVEAQDAGSAPLASCAQGREPAQASSAVLPDGRVSFRLCAPDAHDVRVIIPDAFDGTPPGTPTDLALTRDQVGLWSATTPQPIAPDTYRFAFVVDGVRLPDPQGTAFEEERAGVVSTFEVKGSAGDFQSYRAEVPHGTVSTLEYWSKSLGTRRRVHVYTPPGYMKGGASYPVLYLVHGAAFSDDSWTSLGHAQYILDNLIAAGKANPMIVVMPMGHTPPRRGINPMDNADFGKDLTTDLIPFVDAHFRTLATADERAMAGFSMGGMHTIRFGLSHPELFHAIGIFSMGLGMRGDTAQVTKYEQANDAALKQDAKSLKLLYLAIGDHDPFYSTVAPTRAMFDKYAIRYVYHESGGGHTFTNWRRYLEDFAPRLFR